jgi:hypothetical protein
LKSEWQDKKQVTVNGAPEKLQFKNRLQHTGKDKDYLSMDTQRSKMTELLNEQTDGFRIDTKLPQEVRDTIRSANLVGKSLNAVDWSALPRSDDSIFIQFTQTPAGEGSDGEERERGEDDEKEKEEILPLIDLSCHKHWSV